MILHSLQLKKNVTACISRNASEYLVEQTCITSSPNTGNSVN